MCSLTPLVHHLFQREGGTVASLYSFRMRILTCMQQLFHNGSFLFCFLRAGEKPHVCDVCGKAFSTSSSLNTHRRIHSGEKPHQCPVCGKRFTASSNLYYHRMTHSKVRQNSKPILLNVRITLHKCKKVIMRLFDLARGCFQIGNTSNSVRFVCTDYTSSAMMLHTWIVVSAARVQPTLH